MKLYRKQLNSLEDLKRECIRLNYQKKHTTTEGLLPKMSKSTDKKDKAPGGVSGLVSAAMGLMSGGSTSSALLSMAGPALGILGKGKPGKFVNKIIKDVVVGYVTGKGVQLAVKGVKWYLNKRKQQANERKAIAIVEKIKARSKMN